MCFLQELIKRTEIGITERGDAGIDFSWVDKLFNINIIISKQLRPDNHDLIENLVKYKDKIIFHMTCTGYGGTKIEPNVPTTQEVYNGLQCLLNAGFPIDHVVLRTDPIIPTDKGISVVKNVWDKFSDTGITRCRFSIIDMYPHVKNRFIEEFGTAPFDSFCAPKCMIDNVESAMKDYCFYTFESCAEGIGNRIGCISRKDFDTLGVPFEQSEGGFQRKGCLCCAGKTELLTSTHRCKSKCIYCYWKD